MTIQSTPCFRCKGKDDHIAALEAENAGWRAGMAERAARDKRIAALEAALAACRYEADAHMFCSSESTYNTDRCHDEACSRCRILDTTQAALAEKGGDA